MGASCRRYRILDVEVDAANHRVHRATEDHHLRAQTMAVLIHLLEHRDRLVPKNELLATVWSDVAVTDEALTQCIKEIRRALGDDHRAPRFIRTVPKAGYQFIAPVIEEAAPASAIEIAPPADALEGADPVPTQPLAQLPMTKRWAGRSVLLASCLVAAAALGVTGVLSSSLGERAGERRAADLPASDVVPAVLTANVEAYRAYRSGLQHALSLRGAAALADFQRAVDLDPEFAMARGRIGYTYALVLGDAVKARPHLEAALSAGQRLTDFDRLALQAWYAVANHDFGSAISLSQQMVRQRPRDVEGHVQLSKLLAGEERFDEALTALERGLAIAPDAPEILNGQCSLLSDLRRHREASTVCRRLVAVTPHEPNAYDSLGLALEAAGDSSGALGAFSKALDIDPKSEIAVVHRGQLLFRSGKYSQALAELERYIQMAPPSHRWRAHESLALVHYRRGDTVTAMRHLQLSRETGAVQYPSAIYILIASSSGGSVESLGAVSYEGWLTRGHRLSPRLEAVRQGRYALAVGRSEEALHWFRQAVSHRPVTWSIEWLDDCLADALLQLGRLDEAIAEYERVLGLTPDAGLARYHLAQAYERKGDIPSARTQFARFLEVWREADVNVPEIVAAKRWLTDQ